MCHKYNLLEISDQIEYILSKCTSMCLNLHNVAIVENHHRIHYPVPSKSDWKVTYKQGSNNTVHQLKVFIL